MGSVRDVGRATNLVGDSDPAIAISELQARLANIEDNLLNMTMPTLTEEGNFENMKVVSVKFTNADQDYEVLHSLGYVTRLYIQAGQTAGCQLYDGDKSPTDKSIYIKSDTAGVTVRVIVIG